MKLDEFDVKIEVGDKVKILGGDILKEKIGMSGCLFRRDFAGEIGEVKSIKTNKRGTFASVGLTDDRGEYRVSSLFVDGLEVVK